MEFDANKPIYLQIVDSFCERVLSGELKTDDKILSVRELSAEIGVNPNTVSRSYEKLTDLGVIYTKRGLGYYITADAHDVILQEERKKFVEDELPRILRRAELLGVRLKELL